MYKIVPLGFDDLEHTRSDGVRFSQAEQLNEKGQVIGQSDRFNGSSDGGRSVWLFDGATTINVGLVDVEHTRSDGYKVSESYRLNEAGQAIGFARRYGGGSDDLGETAWLYNGAATTDIGLTGTEFTNSDGGKWSFPYALNDAGKVTGESARFNGSSELGRSVWLYDGASTVDIGLTGAEYTRNDGYKSSNNTVLNGAGQVAGDSQRFNGGSTDLGQTAWRYDGVTTVDIGLSGAEHTRNDGYKSSSAFELNEVGDVRGWSDRYNGSDTFLGETAWLYDGSTTIEIGLAGPNFTRSDGYRLSYPAAFNESKRVSGISDRFNGSTEMGASAWFYNGSTTIEIGLMGVEYTRSDGYKYSYSAFDMNEAGQAIGGSKRFSGNGADLGQSAWLYNGAATTDIGLTGLQYTRNDGYRFSSVSGQVNFVFGQNEAGQVAGYAERYNGGSTQLGQDAWLYDPFLHQTIPMRLSTRSDGYASSTIYYLGEDGLTLGIYTLFDAQDHSVGDRPFYFTIADGMHDLGSLVDGGLPANGWEYLAWTLRANKRGQIIGYGKLTSQPSGSMAFLLTPVPEPSTFALVALGAFGFATRARRR